jgi:uncharacterized protein YecE (DUF72 family)
VSTTSHTIRIGPAGWSYDDWNGIVYPVDSGPKFDRLGYLATYFDTIEINSTFYRPPSVSTAKSWARRVAHNRHFKFTPKLHRTFTHERALTQKDEAEFRAGIDPLAEANLLGALLLQFPWSFKNTDESRTHLAELLQTFRNYRTVVELRHASWNQPAVLEWFSEKGVGFCNIDQPLFHRSIKPAGVATSGIGYVRLHGRNYDNWFSENARASDRYDYLYSLDELEPWVDRIKTVSIETIETYVVTNNHYVGQAAVNALDIKALLLGERVPGPALLAQKYPHLRDHCSRLKGQCAKAKVLRSIRDP